MAAVGGHRGLHLRGSPSQNRRDLCAGLEQLGGLPVNDLEIAFFGGVRVVRVQQLQDFAFGDFVGRGGHHVHDSHAFQRDHHFEGARVDVIADQHAGFVAPDFVGGVAAAAQLGAIDDVVVEQGGGVDEFDDRGGFGMAFAPIATGSGTDHDEQRAQAFAAAADDVFGNLVHQHDVAGEAVTDDNIDLPQIVFDQRFNGLEAHGFQGEKADDEW